MFFFWRCYPYREATILEPIRNVLFGGENLMQNQAFLNKLGGAFFWRCYPYREATILEQIRNALFGGEK